LKVRENLLAQKGAPHAGRIYNTFQMHTTKKEISAAQTRFKIQPFSDILGAFSQLSSKCGPKCYRLIWVGHPYLKSLFYLKWENR
jgi:hypothetical protein